MILPMLMISFVWFIYSLDRINDDDWIWWVILANIWLVGALLAN